MQLTRELVEEFRQLHIDKFGEVLEYGEAEQNLKELADLVRITTPFKEKQ